MNQLYLTNASQQPATHPFVFSRRNEKIDWRRIGMRIDTSILLFQGFLISPW